MTRWYDSSGAHICRMCFRHPKTGWLYRCTQDYNGYLPKPEESIERSLSDTQIRQSEDPALEALSPWIQKAIEDGHYTDDQIKIMKEQKLGVKKAIVAMEERENNLSLQEQGLTCSTSAHLRPLIPRTTTLPPTLCRDATNPSSAPWPLEGAWTSSSRENQKAFNSDTQSDDALPVISHPNPEESSLVSQLENTNVTIPMSLTAPSHLNGFSDRYSTVQSQMKTVFPPCNFITCHTCRPTFRERATLPLNQVLQSEPCNIPTVPDWELENRRVSNLRIVQRLGLARWLQSRKPLIEQMSGSSESEAYLASDTSLATDSSRLAATEGNQGRHRKLVDRWQKTFRKVVDQSRRTSSSRSSDSSDQGDRAKVSSRSMILRRKRKVSSPVPASLNTDSANLKEAMYHYLGVNTPLPGAADDAEHIEGGEVEVEDGIAVTEEGVTLSSADIIIPA